MADSPFAGFHKLPARRRVELVSRHGALNRKEQALLWRTLSASPSLPRRILEGMVENAIGGVTLPMGVATNFLINAREVLVPMAIEEPSVIAAASNAAKMARGKGGFSARASEPIMIGQVHLEGVKDPAGSAEEILRRKWDLLRAARDEGSSLERAGRGPIDLEVRSLREGASAFLAVHLLVDVGDAMGANAVNTRCERLARPLERLTGGKARLRILSNLADRRLAMARATFAADALGGKRVVDHILSAVRIAELDPYRCATHNKGVMNGIDAVALATGNDFRALEAGAHAYAAKSGRYESLTRYHKDRAGDLVGLIELPLAVGTVGGATRVSPTAQLALKILGVSSAKELAEIMAAVGLAQNLAALRALATEGIQAGHMRLHRRLGGR